MAVTIERGAWTVTSSHTFQSTHYEPQIQGDKVALTISAQGHYHTSVSPLAGDTPEERAANVHKTIAALVKTLHSPQDLLRRQVVGEKLVFACYFCKDVAYAVPNAGTGPATVDAWEARHQH